MALLQEVRANISKGKLSGALLCVPGRGRGTEISKTVGPASGVLGFCT